MNSHQDVFRSLDLSAYHLMCQQQLSGDNDQRNDAIICAAHLAAAAAKNGSFTPSTQDHEEYRSTIFNGDSDQCLHTSPPQGSGTCHDPSSNWPYAMSENVALETTQWDADAFSSSLAMFCDTAPTNLLPETGIGGSSSSKPDKCGCGRHMYETLQNAPGFAKRWPVVAGVSYTTDSSKHPQLLDLGWNLSQHHRPSSVEKTDTEAAAVTPLSCPHPSCQSRILFTRQCDFNKHYRSHFRTYHCRISGCALCEMESAGPPLLDGSNSVRRAFSSRKDRDRHERSQFRQFSCEVCGKQFSRQDNMRDHFRKMHHIE